MPKRLYLPVPTVNAAWVIITAVATAGLIMAALVIATGRPAHAQRFTSPLKNVSATIAGKKISIDYYAPSMHGRKVMDGLVPFGEVWCTGANFATAITSDADLTIGDLKVPRGRFSIWTVPEEQQWTLIVNKQTGQSHLRYDETQDLGRTRMNVAMFIEPVETFRIELRPQGGNKGILALLWERTEASIPFTVEK